jgi:hypothetical protein
MNRNHSTASKDSTLAQGLELGTRALDVVSETASTLKKAAGDGEKIVKQYPLASAGAILGAGFLLGAITHKLFSHTPTLTETLGIDALPQRARRQLKSWL